jgi:hypothetical protein
MTHKLLNVGPKIWVFNMKVVPDLLLKIGKRLSRITGKRSPHPLWGLSAAGSYNPPPGP